jgi:hypothetical protein
MTPRSRTLISLLAATLPSSALALPDACDHFGRIDAPTAIPDAEVTFDGIQRNQNFGFSLARVGDFNGDGHDDVAIGAPGTSLNGPASGAVYLYFGPLDDPGALDVESADAVLLGPTSYAGAGWSVQSAGDVDLDGRDDLIIGSLPTSRAVDRRGAAWLVLGRDALTGWVDLATESDAVFHGTTAGSEFGAAVSAGDVNGDGFNDLVVGAPADATAIAEGGAAYVFFGPTYGELEATEADRTYLGTERRGRFATSVAALGDVDGDGVGDLGFGAPRATASGPTAGAAYVFYGDAFSTGSWMAADADILLRGARHDRLGAVMVPAGDLDGDGRQDFWVSAKQYGTTKRGAVFLILGGQEDLYEVRAEDVYTSRIRGYNSNDLFGSSISGPADFDGDGVSDLLVGAERGDGSVLLAGAAWVVHGPLVGVDLTVNPAVGRIYANSALNFGGGAVAAFPDLNGDGFGDALVGAWRADVPGVQRAGRVGLVYGGEDVLDLQPWYTDSDLDGYGDDATVELACFMPAGRVSTSGDCDDANDLIHPYALEQSCTDGIDYNCDGSVGPNDEDGDLVTACGGDCDDANAQMAPTLLESCFDALDNDCDGVVDEADADNAVTWYPDFDGDGFGDRRYAFSGCEAPEFLLVSALTTGGDCDDQDASVQPNAAEVCDGVDNDCNDLTDDAWSIDAATVFADLDGDGFGDPRRPLLACVGATGFVANRDDCDDTDADRRPGAVEVCDALDNDCDGLDYLGGPVSTSVVDIELIGAAETDDLGKAVAWMPDTNGDGRPEVVVAAPSHRAALAAGGTVKNSGAVYVRYGRTEVLSAAFDTTGSGGLPWWDARIVTDRANSFLGDAMVGGDFNGDGVGDLAIGASGQARPNLKQGAVFVFYGPLQGDLTSDDADAVFTGVSGHNLFGFSLAAGDADDDGRDDLLVGAVDADGGGSARGEAYLVYGGTFGSGGRIDQVTSAFLPGADTDADMGWSVAFAGDLDGDGLSELAFGAPSGGATDTGTVTIVRGTAARQSGQMVPSRVVLGADRGDRFGLSLAGVGDVDGDGRDELLVGSKANAAWLLGDLTWDSTAMSVGSFAEVTFEAERSRAFGQAVAFAGDANGDGLNDLLISASDDDEAGRNAGAAMLVYGSASFPAVVPATRIESAGHTPLDAAFPTFSYTNIGGVHGARILGATLGEQLGLGMAGGHDLDGDGFDDLILGGPKGAGNRGRATVLRAGPYGTDVASAIPWSRPLVVDGDDQDWLAATTLPTSMAAAKVNLTWDAERVYFGFRAPEASSGSPSARMVLYLGTEGVWGTTTGKLIGGQQPELPFAASYVVTWRSDGQEVTLHGVDGAYWYEIDGAMDLVADPDNGVVELSLSRAQLGLATGLQAAAWWTFHDGATTLSYAAAPADAFADYSTDPNPATALAVSLLAATSPTSGDASAALFASMSTWLWDRDVDGHGDDGSRDSTTLAQLSDETTFDACPMHVPMVFPNPDRTSATDNVRLQGLADLGLTTDCDDLDAARYDDAPETEGDGVDSNCDGADGGDSAPMVQAWTDMFRLYTNDVATVHVATTDPDAGTDLERPITLDYHWYVNGVRVTAVNGPELDGALYFEKGQSVRVEVFANDGVRTSTPAVVEFLVLNSLPVVTRCEIDAGAGTMYDEITAVAEATDADEGDTVTITFDWAGAPTVHEFDGTSGVLPAGWAGHGNFVWTVCKPHDGMRKGVFKASTPAYIVDPAIGNDLNTAGNDAPIMLSVELSPEDADDDDDLHVVGVAYDPDGDEVTITYSWRVNSVLVPWGEEVQMPWTTDVATADLHTTGDHVRVFGRPFDGQLYGEQLYDRVQIGYPNHPPTARVDLDPNDPSTGTPLFANASANDFDLDPVTLTYTWFIDGVVVPEVTTATMPGSYVFGGSTVEVFVTPHDGYDAGETVFDAVVVVDDVENTPPVLTHVGFDHTGTSYPNEPITVVATAQDNDSDPVVLLYTWQVNGQTVASATGHTLPPGHHDSGDTVTVTVTPHDGTNAGPSTVLTVVVGNHTPIIHQASFTTPNPKPGQQITTQVNATDADGHTVTHTYTWSVNGTVLPQYTGSHLPAGVTHTGDQVQVVITPNDGHEDGTPTTLVVEVTNAPPVVDGVTLVPHAPYPNQNVTANATASDADGDPVTLAYTWTVNGTPVVGATGPTLPHSHYDSDDVIVVTVVANDGYDNSAPATDETTVGNHPPVINAVSLVPVLPGTSQDVTANVNASDPDGDDLTLTYTWTVNGAVVPGATAVTLSAAHYDANDHIQVTVVADDGHDTSAPGFASTNVVNAPPVIDAVTLTPAAPYPNQPVTAQVVAHDPDGHPLTLSYTWTVDGVLVPGATGATLPHSHYDSDDVIVVTVVANDGHDNSAPASDDATVGNHPPVVDSVLLTPDGPLPTDDVTANVSVSDLDGDTVTLTYTWTVDGVLVVGETDETLPASHFEAGQLIAVIVTPFDGHDAGQPGTDNTTVQTPNSPPVIDDVTIVPVYPAPTDDLVADVTTFDADGDDVTLTFQWFIDGVEVPGETTENLPETWLHGGEEVTVTVTPFDGVDVGEPVSATVTVSVPNSPPVIESLVTNPEDVWPWHDVLAIAVASDPDDDAVTITYQWFVDGVEAPGTLEDLLTEDYLEGGELVEVYATPFDGEDYGNTVSTSFTVGVPNSAPVIDLCEATPTTPSPTDYVVGTLTAHDADGDTLVLTKVWYVNGVQVLSGADSLPPTAYNTGDTVTLVCIADDGIDPTTEQTTVTITAPACPTWNASTDVTFSVCGVVTTNTGVPVSGASVKMEYDFAGNVIGGTRTEADGSYCLTGIVMPGDDYPTPDTYFLVVNHTGYTERRITSGASTFQPAACAVRDVNTTLSPASGYSECYFTNFESTSGGWTNIPHALSTSVDVGFERLAYDPANPLLNEAAGYCTEIPPNEPCEVGPGCALCDPNDPNARGCIPEVNAVPAPWSGNHQWWFGRTGPSLGDYSVGNFNGTGGLCRPEGTFTSTDWGSGALIPAPGGWLLPLGGDGGFSRVTTSKSTNWVMGTVESPAIVIPSGSSPTLQFSAWFDIESVDPQKPNNGGYDHVKVEIRRSGQSTATYLGALNPEIDVDGRPGEAFTSGGQNRAPTWNTYSFDLTAYAGRTIYIRFIVFSKDDKYNAFRGAGFDDVRIFDEGNRCN